MYKGPYKQCHIPGNIGPSTGFDVADSNQRESARRIV